MLPNCAERARGRAKMAELILKDLPGSRGKANSYSDCAHRLLMDRLYWSPSACAIREGHSPSRIWKLPALKPSDCPLEGWASGALSMTRGQKYSELSLAQPRTRP